MICLIREESPPFVLRILALELLFDLRVAFAPKGLQVGGDLDRAMVRGEDLNSQRSAPATDREPARRAIQILDASGNRRRSGVAIGDFRGTSVG